MQLANHTTQRNLTRCYFRFQKAGRSVIRQWLQSKLETAPSDNRYAGRLGSLEVADGDFENAVEHLRLAAKV